MPGLALGQAIGRWGNFFNQECFGTYTDNIFAMRLNIETAAYTTQELLKESISKGGVRYIQVHPMFLYESFWCLMLVIIMSQNTLLASREVLSANLPLYFLVS